jgi:hypothetical protein
MFPISIFTCVYWATAHNFDSDIFKTINKVMEPCQIALWGLIEFVLSGAFIVQMWKFHWTSVERQGIFVLILVGVCDTLSVLLNLFIGDLESTCVKGFVYCLRIRLEVSVLCSMVEFVKSKRGSVTFGAPSSRFEVESNANASSNAWNLRTSTHLTHSHNETDDEQEPEEEGSSWFGGRVMPSFRRLSFLGRKAATSGGGATTTTTTASKPQENIRSEISSTGSQEGQEESVDIDTTNIIRNSDLASDQDQHLHDHENEDGDEEQGGIVENSSNGVPLVAIKEDEGQKDESPPNDRSHVPDTTTTFKNRSPVRTSWAGTVVPMGDPQEQE